MYSSRPGLTLGFHGTDITVVQKVVSQVQQLKFENNTWDWLGNGAYFWEYSPARALEFAQTLSKRTNSKIQTPAVIGAVLDLGYCLDLLDYKSLTILKTAYTVLTQGIRSSEFQVKNRPAKGNPDELLIRELDCAVVETVHTINRDASRRPFDSVRGVFWEGICFIQTQDFGKRTTFKSVYAIPIASKASLCRVKKIDFKG